LPDLQVFAAGFAGLARPQLHKMLVRSGLGRAGVVSPRGTDRGPCSGSVVIRIDSSQQGPTVVLHLAGSLAGLDVGILRDSVASQGLPDQIDLSEVEFLDADGASALLGLEARGARLVGAEPFVELLLRTVQGSPSQ